MSIFFTPGPSQLYPTIPYHISKALKENIPSISHRSEKFQKIFLDTTDSLRKLMIIPKSHHIFFLSSSLESMERIIQNTVYKQSLHYVNGAFSKKFYEISLQLGKTAIKIEAPLGQGFNIKSAIVPEKTEVICITQNETSTGVSIPMEDVYSLKKKHPQMLIALDIVSSAPYPDIDFSKIDMAFFSVQKCFGLPAGLGILIVNGKAVKKSYDISKKVTIGTFHCFSELINMAQKNQTPETPNVLYIYLIGKICDDMLEKGIDKIRSLTDKKAKILYDFFDNNPEFFSPFVKENKYRSKTTVVIDLLKSNSQTIASRLKKKGIVVGKGYGKLRENQIRIANFPAHSLTDFKQFINILR